MSQLVEKFIAVKTAVGGNREKKRFEWTFGMPVEEQHRITPPNAGQRRILGELEFALKLSAARGGEFDGPIAAALEFLLAAQARDGALTNATIDQAESLLLPLSAAAKEYSLILAAHAHIDMNWMWGWQETVAATLDTFRTMLSIMEEYPDFCYSQSQASVYQIVEDHDPEMAAEIRRHIAEGRWEVTASAWVETDKNMPNTESLARHILYTKKYMQEHWGVPPESLEIDFSPDTFGHSANLPELISHGGVKYYYHCRGYDGPETLYRWRAPSGKEVLIYREPYWYNSGITPQIGIGLVDQATICGGLKTGLIVYGVGDHGGGPTRRDVERAIEMQSWPVFPRVRFGTFREFFREAESVRDRLNVVESELNFIFTGCYTTQSRVKLGNRKAEAALIDAEAFNALSKAAAGAPYRTEKYEQAWQKVLFTHFHDILTGSCVQDSREHAMGLFSEAMGIANAGRAKALHSIAARIDTSAFAETGDIAASQSEGAGVGWGVESFAAPATERGAGLTRLFHVFNPSAHPRTEVVELTVWDWTGDMRRVAMSDGQGAPLRCQLVDSDLQHYWDHKYFRVLVEVSMPALGYATCVLSQSEAEVYELYYQPNDERRHHPYADHVLENDKVRAVFDWKSAVLKSFVDKETGTELIRPGEPAGLEIVQTDGHTANAWLIGRYISAALLDKPTSVRRTTGALRDKLEAEYPFLGSSAKVRYSLEQGSAALRVELTVDWHEVSRDGTEVPLLRFRAPLACPAGSFLYDIPGGAATRSAAQLDMPALQYGAAACGDRALALISDCKYGMRGADDTLAVTLIHAPHGPDPDPERGIHQIRLAIAAADYCPKALEELAFDVNHAPAALSARPHAGDLPLNLSMLELARGTTAVLSAVKQAEDGSGIIARLYNTAGEATMAKLVLPFAAEIKAAVAVDIMEQDAMGGVSVSGNAVEVKIGAYAMAAVKIVL